MDDSHVVSAKEVLTYLHTSFEGLSEDEAARRIEYFGKNCLEEKETSKFLLFFRQFHNILVYILCIASIMSALAGKWFDVSAIVIIIVINAIFAFFQELKAAVSIKALKKLTETKAAVLRNGQTKVIPSSDLVPGDIVFLSEGDRISADIRLFASESLLIDESSITGESIPVIKDPHALLEKDIPVYEKINMLLTGTHVVRGEGRGIVVKTGKDTYFASITQKALSDSPETPLTKAMGVFSKKYLYVLLFLLGLIAIVGLVQKRAVFDVLYTLVAQLVSAVPEGLPIVVTLVLVIGAMHLSKKKTYVRYLPAVETLGSTTVIASDKTGTITEGKLHVQSHFSFNNDAFLQAISLCNTGKMENGDPLDSALLSLSPNFLAIRQKYKEIFHFPFDVYKRWMATVNEVDGKKVLYVKGAFEEMKKIARNADTLALLEEKVNEFSSSGLRVIAIGQGEYLSEDMDKWSIDIIGLVGFLDPAKKGVKEAVALAKNAKVKVFMITGDFPLTAIAVAKQVGIFEEGNEVLTGLQMEKMRDEEVYEACKKTTVFARFLPEDKYRLVKVLQMHKEIVAVSGDGINDVPALRIADLGIAMGGGSEAARSVAKMVIGDNNLRVIVEAIKNGRVIADNLRKVLYYLLSTSIQGIVFISVAILSGLPLPLFPIQILWINLVGDGVQDKTFPFAKEEGDVMERKPIPPGKQFFGPWQIFRILFFGISMGIVGFFFFLHLLKGHSYLLTTTILFCCVVCSQWINGIQAQKESEPFLKNMKRSFTINPLIFAGVACGLVLQLLAIYLLSGWFHAEYMPLSLWLYPLYFSLITFFIVELRKWLELFLKRKR